MRFATRTITRRSTTSWPPWTLCPKARLNRDQRIVPGGNVRTDGTESAVLFLLHPRRQARMPDSTDNADSVMTVGILPMAAVATCMMEQVRPPRLAPRKPA